MIDAYKVLSALADRKQYICQREESEMFKDLLYILTLSGTELNDAMDNFRQKYIGSGFNIGDECYYDKHPEHVFVLTRIWLDKDGLDKNTYYFDAIYHDGETISDGTLYLVKKTGNKYKINLEPLGG